MKLKKLIVPLILVVINQFNSFAQDRYVISRLESTIDFDGLSNEDAWDHIAALPLITFLPDYGATPREPTIIKVAYDENYLYAACTMFDSNPDKWQIQLKRDDWKYNCDWFGLILDTFNDKENTIVFATSPSGGRTDVAFSNDNSDLSKDMNLSWNTFWDVKTVTDDQAWHVEMRIPFSSLRFQDVDGEVIMGITAFRYLSNSFETYTYPQPLEKHGFWGIYKASQAQEVVFKGLKSKKPLYIAPYLLGGFGQKPMLNETGDAYMRENKYLWNAGADIKYRISDNLTMDVSINTDFAQVEADDQQVNLTRFSLFFPEKRLFFQERRSNFEFNFDQQNRLFYTRRIGINDGEPVGIYGGGRLVGRIGSWDMGVLSMQAAPSGDLFSENFSVARFRRQVINENSYVGGILTNRMDLKGNFNTAYGIDGIFRLFGDDYLNVMWAQTFETTKQNNALSLDPARIYLNWQRRTKTGLGYDFSYSRAGSDFDPGIGYERRHDYSKGGISVLYGWLPDRKRIYLHKIQLDAFEYLRNAEGALETAEGWLRWDVETKSGATASFIQKIIHDDLIEDFYLSKDVYVPASTYTFSNFTGDFSTPRGKSLRLESKLNVGQFFDGWINSISFSPTGVIKNRAEISGTYQLNHASFPTRDMQFIAHIFRLNGTLVFNTKLSFAAFIQYNSAVDAVLANARLRFNPKEGTDLYLVYNEGYNTDRYMEYPRLPLSSQRTIMIKYTYTFIL